MVFVVADDELFECWGWEGGGFAARAEALPSLADGAVDVDEDEVRSAGEDVDALLVVDGGCNEVLLPVLGGEVQEVGGRGEGLGCWAGGR